MARERFDVIIIGAGAMGSAALWRLARRGLRAVAIEQLTPGHDRGSSHGQTRIIRKAYFEHPDYVPLLHRAYALWDELDAETPPARSPVAQRTRLFERCGLLLVGRPDGPVIPGVRRAAAAHSLAIDAVSDHDVRREFSAFHVPRGMSALFEPDAGFLRVEDCVCAMAERGRAHGGVVRANCRVKAWRASPSRVCVETDSGELEAGALVIAAGAWSARLLGELNVPLEVRRKVQLWMQLADSRLTLESGAPVFAFDTPEGFFYGFPAQPLDPHAIKVAEHTGRQTVPDADSLDRALHDSDVLRVRDFAAAHLAGVGPEVARHSACMYTMTPDEHFIVDRHPAHANVVVLAGFSGHGFKFAPLMGEVAADWICDAVTSAPVGFLSLGRRELRR
ncbi:MAG: N-methyl-L-tryptophan oxidase [Phycisphaerae bacterium]